jgi:ribonuclease D
MVTSRQQLDEVLASVRAAGRMGLDTEFLREKTYFARLCLAQVATPERVFLIDPTRGLDVSPLAGLLADPAGRTCSCSTSAPAACRPTSSTSSSGPGSPD